MTDSARRVPTAYAERVLALVERRALYADRVDWPATRDAVLAVADTAGAPADLHDALSSVVRLAGGRHSGLLARGARPRTGLPGRRPMPAAREVDGAGVLVLPACPQERRAYVAAGGRALRSLPAVRGWVVDLRGNSGGSDAGGSLGPMLAVAAPLLRADGQVGAFVYRNGERAGWWVRRGRVWVGGGRRPRARSRGPADLAGPVAVLTDSGTAGSGEAVAVAFRGAARSYGGPTSGVSTAAETFRLPDGALLVLTSARFADRAGVVYGGPVPPDLPTDDPLPAALAELAGR